MLMGTIKDHFLRYLRVERNASSHTIEAYSRDLDQFASFCESRGMDPMSDASSLDRLTIRLWLGALSEDGMAKSTVARKAASLRSFFRYAARRGHIDVNPAHSLTVPKSSKRIPAVLSTSDMDAMLADVGGGTDPASIQERAILELLYSSGLRVSELTGLDVGDVDLHQAHVKVLGKGSKERIVPVGRQALDAVMNHLRSRSELLKPEDSDAVAGGSPGMRTDALRALFLSKRGVRIRPRAVQKMVHGRIDRVSEISKKSPHVIRHSFATHMLNAGADIRMIKELLGHASLAATQVYTHTGVEHLKRIHGQAHPRSTRKESQP